MRPPTVRLRLAGFLSLFLLTPAFLCAQAPTPFVFRPIAAQAPTNWRGEFNVSAELHQALQAYESRPDTDTAIGVLRHFDEFRGMDTSRRGALLARDDALFQSIDFMKYELVMQTRARLADQGAAWSRRVGSSGAREAAIIKWVREGRVGPPPKMDFEKQFKSDDDVTLYVNERLAETDVLAHEKVNGTRADAVYREVARLFKYTGDFDPKLTETEFLSPTEAWGVVPTAEMLQPGDLPTFLYEMVRSNPEKYNDHYAIEMLEVWAWDKGRVTRDLKNPIREGATVEAKTLSEKPPRPSSRGEFAYIADNYRQIFDVHAKEQGNTKFLTQCKYLVRMIDAWEARSGPGSLPPNWKAIRDTADRLYMHGLPGSETPPGPTAAFRAAIEGHIAAAVEKSHEYHLDRVAESIKTAMEKLGPRAGKNVSMRQLIAEHPPLADELNLLAVGYTNLPENIYEKLADQLRRRIRAGHVSDDLETIYKSQVFTHLMAATRDRVNYSRQESDAYVKLRELMEARFSEHLNAVDLDTFIEKLAKGEVMTPQWRLVDGEYDVRLVEVQVSPTYAVRDVRLVNAVATLFRWNNEKYAKFAKEYFDSRDPGMSIRILRSMWEVFDTSDPKSPKGQRYVQYPDVDGTVVRKTIPVSGTSLAALLFKAAGKGADIFGQVQSGRELYDRLARLHQGTLSKDQLGEAYATILNSYLALHDLVKPEDWFAVGGATNIVGQFAMGGVGGVGTAGEAGAEATRELAWAAFKDITALYCPQLAVAIGLAELANWGWKEYKVVPGEKNAITTAMLENGVWYPANPTEMKSMKPGEAPRLLHIKQVKDGPTFAVESLAKVGFDMELIESKTRLVPREALLDLSHDGGYLEGDPVIKADIDAVKQVSDSWLKFLRVGTISSSERDWSKDYLASRGILIARREDEIAAASAEDVTVDENLRAEQTSLWPWGSGLKARQLELIGFVVMEFWSKRQTVIERAMLPELEKAAGRLWIDKLTEQEVEAGNYEFMEEIRKIDESVKEIDKQLWLRIARSADPYPGPAYDPEVNTAILRQFQLSTAALRTALQEFETFLKDPSRTELVIDNPLTAYPGTRHDRKSVARLAIGLLRTLRTEYNERADYYDEVHALMKRATDMVAEGKVQIEPFHLSFDPDRYVASRPLELAAGGPLTDSEAWLTGYRNERIRIARDITDRAKTQPVPEGLLEAVTRLLAIAGETTLGVQSVDTFGSPAHPLWPQLARLRYQIHKINLMHGFGREVTAAEARQALDGMTIKEGERVPLTGLATPVERASTFVSLMAKMEVEYRRLLEKLTQMFQITMEIKPLEPFIGQEALVRASSRFETGQPVPRLARHGFPEFVRKFRWITYDSKGNRESTSEDASPEFKAVFKKTGLNTVILQALDSGGNSVAEGKVYGIAKPLKLLGETAVEEGDYNDQPVSVAVAATAWQAGKMGPFSVAVTVWDAAAWNGPSVGATVTIDDKTYASSRSTIDADPAAGRLLVADLLRFKLPYNVTISVDVQDRAGLDVPAAEVILLAGGAEVGRGRSAQVKVERGQMLGARVEFAPLSLVHEVPQRRFEPDAGRDLRFKAALEMFDAGHLTVTGRFVPERVISPQPQLTGGNVASNVGQTIVAAGGRFSFTNRAPLDMRPRPKFESRAVVTDASRKMYRPKVEPIVAPIADKVLDLGQIEVKRGGILVKPITARLFDRTDKPLPAADGQVAIGGTPAVNKSGLFEGEYSFEELGQEITIEGRYVLPDGRPATAEQKLSLRQLGSWQNPTPPPTYHFVLPFYLPGTLPLTGSTRAVGVPQGQSPPSMAALQDQRLGIRHNAVMNSPFEFTLTMPMHVGEALTFDASGGTPAQLYTGRGSARVPEQPGPANFGEIILRLVSSASAETKPPAAANVPPAVRVSNTKTNPPPAADEAPRAVKASSTASGDKDKPIAHFIYISDDRQRKLHGDIWYEVLQTGASVTAMVRFADGTEGIVGGVKIFEEAFRRGFYRKVPGVGTVRTGRETRQPRPTPTQAAGEQGGGGSGGAARGSKPPASASGGQAAGDGSSGDGGRRGLKRTGTGATLLGVDFRSEPETNKETEEEFTERIRKYNELSVADMRRVDDVRNEAEALLVRCRQKEEDLVDKCRKDNCDGLKTADGWDDREAQKICGEQCRKDQEPLHAQCTSDFQEKHKEADRLTATLYQEMMRKRQAAPR